MVKMVVPEASKVLKPIIYELGATIPGIQALAEQEQIQSRNFSLNVKNALQVKLEKTEKLIVAIPYAHWFCILSRSPGKGGHSSFDALLSTAKSQKDRKTVGFVSESERFCFERIAYAHGVTTPNNMFEFIRAPTHDSLLAQTTRIDVFAVFIPKLYSNAFLQSITQLGGGEFTVHEYFNETKTEKDKLRFFMPFCKFEPYDFRKIFTEHERFFKIIAGIEFDLVVTSASQSSKLQKEELDGIIRIREEYLQNQKAETSFLSMFLDTDSVSLKQIQNNSELYSSDTAGLGVESIRMEPSKDTSSSSTITPFQTNGVNLVAKGDIEGGTLVIHPSDEHKFLSLPLTNENLKSLEVPLYPGDVLILNHQKYKKENGAYIVTDVSPNTLMLSSHIVLQPTSTRVLKTTKDTMEIEVTLSQPISQNVQNMQNMQNGAANVVYISGINRLGTVVKNGNLSSNKLVVSIVIPRANRVSVGEHKGKCVTDINIQSKEACESKFDHRGDPKTLLDIWDAPCEKDTDCPFFQANTNYKNSRGGCNNGFCELPVGVRRLSYRKYSLNDESYPYCYKCKDPSRADCCEDQQKNPSNYQGLTSPDYAFSMDTFDRYPFLRNTSL